MYYCSIRLHFGITTGNENHSSCVILIYVPYIFIILYYDQQKYN